ISVMRLFLSLFLLISSIHSYKILVYNIRYSHSHSNFLGNVADILVEAGHNVTSLIPMVSANGKDGTTKSKIIRIEGSLEARIIDLSFNRPFFPFPMKRLVVYAKKLQRGTPYADQFAIHCRGVLEKTALIEKLREEKFDVMITENFDMCGIGLVHLIKPKSLINGAAAIPITWMNQEFGLPAAWSYNPSPLNSNLDVHSMWSRLNNLFAEAIFYRQFYSSRSLEISSHAAYTIINSEPLVDYAVPTLSRVEINDILSLRPRTVLISFGSIVIAHELQEELKNNIIESVAKFPDVTFIWKYEKPEDAFAKNVRTKVPNLHLLKWVPQNDLLADDRLVAFITHGGMGSTQETTVRGKPGLFIPCFGDQPRNAAMMEKSGLGKVTVAYYYNNLRFLSQRCLFTLWNFRYHENAKRIAAMIAKKPFSAREQLIRTVEFAAEFGPSPALRPQSYDMGFIAYHNLDIIFLFCVVTLIFLYVLTRIIRIVL
ncbi:hypothetical protein PFISCL1PPCAC_6956, partial [Pristionchus fissidentatus]